MRALPAGEPPLERGPLRRRASTGQCVAGRARAGAPPPGTGAGGASGAGRCSASRMRSGQAQRPRRGRLGRLRQEARPGSGRLRREARPASPGGVVCPGGGTRRNRFKVRSEPAGALGATASRSRRGHSAGRRRASASQAPAGDTTNCRRRVLLFLFFFVCDFDVESICDVNQINIICCELISCIVD